MSESNITYLSRDVFCSLCHEHKAVYTLLNNNSHPCGVICEECTQKILNTDKEINTGAEHREISRPVADCENQASCYR